MLMRTVIAAVLFLIPLACAADIGKDIAAADGWASWQVAKVADAGEPCCYDIGRSGVDRIGCDLDGGNWSISIGDNHASAKPTATDTLTVYAHIVGGKVDRIRAYAATCPVNTRQALRPLAGVSAKDSVDWLERQAVADGAAKKLDDEPIMALAFHADAAAQSALVRMASTGQPEKRREAALFWLGQARGAAGVSIVEGFARDDASEDIRRHALFVLSQAEDFDTYPKVLASAQNDRSGEVRSQALFWLAQMKDARASQDIVAALRREKDAEVREQAVFALSQLPDGQNDAALIGIMRGDYPREVKQKALFWLGQSGSDSAMAFLDEVLR
jgi:hypothetical protein